ncbi:MAG: hypothetical protein Q7K65_05010 [Candidatus Buchananbacteria bacterium]|nr:hypothetical protein [Candidatus Buchananbacteria bacterium]
MPFNFDFSRFFNSSRFFDFQPAISLDTVYFLLELFGVLLILAAVVKAIQKFSQRDSFYKTLLQKYFIMLTTMSVIGFFLTWFRYERAYLLSARFWLLVWLIGTVVWLAFILKYQIKVMPQAREKLQKTREFNKYLPKKK